MARPVVISQTGVGTTKALQLDHHLNPFNVGFGAVVNGTATYTVQHTFDDPQAIAAQNMTWFDHSSVAAQTANAQGNYAFPIQASRLNVTAGTGTVTLTILQAGIAR